MLIKSEQFMLIFRLHTQWNLARHYFGEYPNGSAPFLKPWVAAVESIDIIKDDILGDGLWEAARAAALEYLDITR